MDKDKVKAILEWPAAGIQAPCVMHSGNTCQLCGTGHYGVPAKGDNRGDNGRVGSTEIITANGRSGFSFSAD